MIVEDAQILVNNKWLTKRGWYFGVLGPAPSDGSDRPFREQFENALFTRDYANNFFDTDTVYYFYGRHPVDLPTP